MRSQDLLRPSPLSFFFLSLSSTISRNEGSVLGIIGLGAIGSAVAMRAAAFGMKVVFYDPYVSDGHAKSLNAKRFDDLLDLARQADCVSVNCLRTAETINLVDAVFLAAMRPGGFLVNTARGGIVNEQAVLEALQSHHLAGCALDVVDNEPVGTAHPLLGLSNVILTPHVAWFSQESVIEMRETAADIVLRDLTKRPIRSVVNLASLTVSE
eukprot:m.179530 g.179530  ORF g.179530 m.179530 type:complete len:211 (+) comp53425_c0_seq5:479-1111(+)